MANTSADENFARWYQDDIRGETGDNFADLVKPLGEQWPMVSTYLAASFAGRYAGVNPKIYRWGDRSIRAMLVGVPPLLLFQKALGSSRPNDPGGTSDWHFWNDNNGASGHTFVAAVPFLTAATLARRPLFKSAWIAGSTLTGWSRINDNDHFLSQVIVGWWLAHAAVKAVSLTENQTSQYRMIPLIHSNRIGLGIELRR